MKRFTLFLLFLVFILESCKKGSTSTTNTPNQPIVISLDFSLSFPDSILFDNIKTLSGNFECKKLTGSQNPYVSVWIDGNLPAGVSHTGSVSGTLDLSGSFSFTCTTFTPGVYPFSIKASADTTYRTKTCYLVMRPNCSFEFNSILNTKTTTYPSGVVNYSTKGTQYNSSNNLIIYDIFVSKEVELIFNCENKTVSMIPFYLNGYNYTGSGYYNNTTLFLDIYSNGTLSRKLEMSK
jgi:hypothetical protein